MDALHHVPSPKYRVEQTVAGVKSANRLKRNQLALYPLAQYG